MAYQLLTYLIDLDNRRLDLFAPASLGELQELEVRRRADRHAVWQLSFAVR